MGETDGLARVAASDDDADNADRGTSDENTNKKEESSDLPFASKLLMERKKVVPRPEGFVNFESFAVDDVYEQVYGRRRRLLPGERADGSESDSVESEDPDDEEDQGDIWGLAPMQLLSRPNFKDAPEDFIGHFVRYIIGAWKRHLVDGTKIVGNGLTESSISAFNSVITMRETEEALSPLLHHLKQRR